MQDDKNKSRHYSELVWIVTSEYTDNKYKSSNFTIDDVKNILNKIENSISSLNIDIHNLLLYNFKLVKEVSNYLSMFKMKTEIFVNPLIILPYTSDKYITRDFYLANLIKLYKNYDIIYINCPDPTKIFTKVYNSILMPNELEEKLPIIIQNGC